MLVGVLAGAGALATGAVVFGVGDDADVATVEVGVAADGGMVADLVDRVRAEVGLPDRVDIDPDCTLSERLELGMRSADVTCLESKLISVGALANVVPDDVFDTSTRAGVEMFQAANALVVDGVVGSQTALALDVALASESVAAEASTCPKTGRSAVIDRRSQRTWLCERGEVIEVMPMTSAITQPDPGTYSVYAKDMNSSSAGSGRHSTMTHFVAFTYGKHQGARIAFHSVPRYTNGEFVQPLDSLGTGDLHGDSAGCIRVAPEDAELIWRWLDIGDTVTVIT